MKEREIGADTDQKTNRQIYGHAAMQTGRNKERKVEKVKGGKLRL